MMTIAEQARAHADAVCAVLPNNILSAPAAFSVETFRPLVYVSLPAPCNCCECPTCDARIDRWNDGALDGARGHAARRQDADYLAGHAEGSEMRKVRPMMIERPEGYYHQPIGTFDDAPGWMLTEEEIAMIPHRDGAIAPELCA